MSVMLDRRRSLPVRLVAALIADALRLVKRQA